MYNAIFIPGASIVFLTLEKVLHPLSLFSGARNIISPCNLVLTLSPSVIEGKSLALWEQPGRGGEKQLF